MELELLSRRFKEATAPEDVFGAIVGSSPDQLQAVRRLYRQMARVVHPDIHANGQRDLAHQSFQKLNEWYEGAQFKVGQGTYGDRTAPYRAAEKYEPIELIIRGKK